MSVIAETWEYRVEIVRDGTGWKWNESGGVMMQQNHLHEALKSWGEDGWEVISILSGEYMFNANEHQKGVQVIAKRRTGAKYLCSKD